MPIALPLTAGVGSKTISSETEAEAAELRQFGGYELIEKIARGGMGVVYKARDTKANRTVALKMVLGGHFAGEEEMRRFRTEAEAVASMDHPNIVPLYEVGEVDKHPFFTMKFIEGGSLADRLWKKDTGRDIAVRCPRPPSSGRNEEESNHANTTGCAAERGVESAARRPCQTSAGAIERFSFDQRESARLIAKVAHAIHHAHQRGILHRDLKPANILLDAKSEPFVTDFGIARRLEDDSDLTRTGAVMGTPNYMSPEQAAGKTREITTAADIYSLGAIFYHLLTGRPPFEADTPLETIRHVLDKEPERPTSVNGQADLELETICLKCLEKEPHNRYDSAAALAEDLERWSRNETIFARRATPAERAVKWVRRKPIIASLLAAIVVAVVAGVVGIFMQWREAEAARRISESKTKEAEQRTVEAQQQRTAADSARRSAEAMLTRIELEKADLQLSQGNSAGALAYFARVLRRDPENLIATSRIMSFLRRRTIALTETLTPGTDRRVIDFALSPDYAHVAASFDEEKDNFKIWNLEPGSSPSHLATVPLELPAMGRGLTPRGAMQTPGMPGMPPGMPPGMLASRMAASMSIVPIRVGFSDDGSLSVVGSNSGHIRVWNTTTGQPVTPFFEDDFVMDMGITRDNKSVISVGRMGGVNVWSIADGKRVHSFASDFRLVQAALSPDLSRVLTVAFPATAQVWDVESGKPLAVPLHLDESALSVDWSKDSARVLIIGGSQAWLLQTQKKNSEGAWQKYEHPFALTTATFSPDNETFATGCDDQIARVWNTQSKEPFAQLKHVENLTSAVFSHTGKQLATVARDKGVRLWDIATGELLCEPLMHQTAVHSVRFSKDDQKLIVMCRDGAVFRYRFVKPLPVAMALHGTTENDNFTFSKNENGTALVSFSPDSEQILIVENKSARLWETKSGQPLAFSFAHGEPVVATGFSPDGSRVLTAGTDSIVKIWDAKSGQLLGKPLPHSSVLLFARFSPDGEQVWTLVDRGLGKKWSARTGESLVAEKGGALLEKGRFSLDGKIVLGTFGVARGAALYDFSTGEMISFMKHSDRVNACDFSRDGSKIITASSDSTARIWNSSTGRPLSDFLRHEGVVHYANFSADGKTAVTASQDKTARLWSTVNGASLLHTLLHPAAVRYAEFSGDGQRLLTVVDDFSVHLWDTRLGQRIVDPFYAENKVVAAHFSPDGRHVFLQDELGVAKIWSVPVVPLPAPVWLADFAELIGGLRIDDNGLTQPAARESLDQWRKILKTVPPEDFYASELERFFAEANEAR